MSDETGPFGISLAMEMAKLNKPSNSPYAAKAAFKVEKDVEAFVNKFGVEKCGFLTLNFRKSTSPRKAAKIMKRMGKTFAKHFDAYSWVLVIERRGSSRSVHIHAVVASPHDLRSGTDFVVYKRHRAIAAKAADECRRMTSEEIVERKSLKITTNPVLLKLWAMFRHQLPKFGFAKRYPFELMPIETNAEAIGRYMAKNFRGSFGNREKSDGKIRLRGASKNAPVVVKSANSISWASHGARTYRLQAAEIARSIDVHSMEEMRDEYGPKWAYKTRRIVAWINAHHLGGENPPSMEELRRYTEFVMGPKSSSIPPPPDYMVDIIRNWEDRQRHARELEIPTPTIHL